MLTDLSENSSTAGKEKSEQICAFASFCELFHSLFVIFTIDLSKIVTIYKTDFQLLHVSL